MLNLNNLSTLNFIPRKPGGDAPAPAPDLTLNTYPGAAAAYSTRKLDKDYIGSAIRVRRSSDNVEQDIGFDSGGDLDEAALTSFVGANDGFVTTWYDQSGNGYDATQSTASAQPKIVSAGTVVKENGKPALELTTTSQHLFALNVSNAIQTAFGVYEFDVLPADAVNGWVWSQFLDSANAMGALGLSTNNKIISYQVANGSNTGVNGGFDIIAQENLLITDILDDTNTLKGFKNSSEFRSVSAYSPTHGGGNLFIGEYDGTHEYGIVGTISELIFYPSDQSANRTGIEGDINSYYNIY